MRMRTPLRRLRLPRPRPLSLTGSLFVGYLTLLVLSLTATGALWIAHHERELDRQYEERVLTIARSVAATPQVAEGLATDNPPAVIDPLADAVADATGAQYVVVATPEGIRMSHVDDSLIGKRVSTPPGKAALGQEWSGEQTGTQGRSVRAKVPVLAPGAPSTTGGDTPAGGTVGSGTEALDHEDVIGYVSVGVLTSDIAVEATNALPSILGTIVSVLLIGATGAYVLSRRVRAKTYGLEPADITSLLESREALLYAVREGVLAVDSEGRVVLANPPARQMLDLAKGCEGKALHELGLEERLRDIIAGADPGEDRIVLVGPRILVCNRMPVSVHGHAAGAVVTLRDRTELARLAGELDGARTVTRGLRAQSHEFANRIHTVAGMLELGATAEAREYLTSLSAAHTRASGEISGHIADPALAALALAKSAQASEQGAELRLSPMTLVSGRLPSALRSDVLLVLGNLVDNALDSVAAQPGGWVELLIRVHRADPTDPAVHATGAAEEDEASGGLPHDLVEVRVIDSGHGVSAELAEEIFDYGFTTKAAQGTGVRGLGLALVRQVCESRGGSIGVETPGEASCEEGAVFTAYLPVLEAGPIDAGPGSTAQADTVRGVTTASDPHADSPTGTGADTP